MLKMKTGKEIMLHSNAPTVRKYLSLVDFIINE